MQLILNPKEFEHCLTESSYNRNYYKNVLRGYKILEICHEDENYYDFYLILGINNVFLGCSLEGLNGIKNTVIDFKTHYT